MRTYRDMISIKGMSQSKRIGQSSRRDQGSTIRKLSELDIDFNQIIKPKLTDGSSIRRLVSESILDLQETHQHNTSRDPDDDVQQRNEGNNPNGSERDFSNSRHLAMRAFSLANQRLQTPSSIIIHAPRVRCIRYDRSHEF